MMSISKLPYLYYPLGYRLTEPEEYEANIEKGYRSLVGTVLWPARNTKLNPSDITR